ncbi:sodium/hydrogen exchanger family protein [Oleispira antarctica RB-8]|uniref:Sodium/hydrogen exchanger family protein n=1 Tax=Oleispira antarctica RB-8 TaxID=698738 RepID=R4YMF3_OLEAN|nr:sodium/hydrogen exchanger family protein [Oleispira antarctica RB-8]
MEIPDLLMLGLIGILGFACQILAWWVKIPAILFLLLTGIVLGPVTGLFNPDALFGDFLFSFISLCVAVILFEGSLTLKRTELKEIGSTVRNMVTYGAVINATITTIAAHYIASLSWSISALFGAIMVVTGPTVIMPILQSVRPNLMISRTLRWEGIIIDPFGALFAVLIFEWIVAQQTGSDWLHVLVVFGQTVFIGALFGVLAGYCLGLLLRHHLIPKYLHNFAALAFVTGAFSLSNTLMHESGLLTVTIMGIWLVNMRGVNTKDILSFKESLTIMFVSALFIILSARVDLDTLYGMGWGAVGVFLVVQFVSRPVKVFVSTIGSKFTYKERAFLSWVGPRGIVAAAVSVVFAIKLEELNMENAELLVPLAFSVIIGTVLLQGLTARPLAKLLGVESPATKDVLVIGANPVSIVIAEALNNIGVKTLLCDSHWEDISAARMKGLKTYFGNPVSDHAEMNLELNGFNTMLGLSRHSATNNTTALRFREDFGVKNVFTLPSEEDLNSHKKHLVSDAYKGHTLFGANITYTKLNSFINQNGLVKNTQLSDTYQFEHWMKDNDNDRVIPLFVLDKKGRIHWFTSEHKPTPESGWKVFSLSIQDID